MISCLEVTRDIWKGLSDTSIEAFKASNILEVMLVKIKSFEATDQQATSSGLSAASGAFGARGSTELQPEHSAALTLGMLSTGAMSEPSTAFPGTQTAMGPTYGTLGMGLDAGPSPRTGSSTGIPSVPASEFSNPMVGFELAPSPLTMFENMASNNMDFSGNFDWVRVFLPPHLRLSPRLVPC
jgi:hypothetical protein